MQPGLRTVQGVLEAALGTVLRTDGPPRVTVAGRTDSGVHARGQVAHVDIPAGLLETIAAVAPTRPVDEALLTRLGGVLPTDLVVHALTRAPDGFDARFSALRRRYTYRICDDAARRDPLSRAHVLWHRRPLDVDAMASPARPLVGRHDFASYCKPRAGGDDDPHAGGRSAWSRPVDGPDAGLVVATVQADAFCHSMVRSLVGASLAVGEGRRGRELAGRAARRAAPGRRACTSSPRTGSRSRRWATRPTTSWPRGRCRRGRVGRPRTCSTRPAAAADAGQSSSRFSVGLTLRSAAGE